ncbi:MAG: ATP-dependent 6-phosphofructokinase [Candidatus Auribacter fodinae]|jgi:6-phosphofructokinase 1|uniref:ATP-dependent 6-phosphofructokinase n=1 Tax=Candidatus Auribacter fodinae TaxID=2093366 RepID=A0A3A4RAE4_9BACT|nr:MAG: ATP-dependent 6-phosphofructokinase [Candidatus Auribacter fodinae]
MNKCIGVLTSGGDNPGLNAALRGLGKAAIGNYGMHVIGFKDGFRGLANNHTIRLDEPALSGILTLGGTILGTSRDKPHRMVVGDKTMDMTDVIVENYNRNHLDVLVCIGGGGTQKNAFRLMEKGLNIITLPKTIDNDVAMTDVTIGFDTALSIATDAIDRLHSTAHSHHRIILVEIMGHKAGWLALGAGLAGGADIILIPEIPYDANNIANAIVRRFRKGKRFSIVAVAEGARSVEDADILRIAEEKKKNAKTKKDKELAEADLNILQKQHADNTVRLANQLQSLTGLDFRVTILGYIQRGGIPSANDRLLATRLGAECADLIQQGKYGVMVSVKGNGSELVPLDQVAGKRKTIPLDHEWIKSAQKLDIFLGN